MSSVLSGKEFGMLSRLINEECGIKMPAPKKIMLEARLRKRVRVLGMKSFKEYCDYLFSPEGMTAELVPMIDVVTTNKTDFFREPRHFEFLARSVLPEMKTLCGKSNRTRLTVWSAGCSTGEEPYSIGMVLSEFAENHPGFDFVIIASDISTKALDKALRGVYPENRVDPVPQPLKKKYLLKSKDKERKLVRIIPELRERVEFRRINFMDEDFGFSEPVDIIFCRNVIIYFAKHTQEVLLNRFHHLLRPAGYLFMGHSETLSGMNLPFVPVGPTVYRSR